MATSRKAAIANFCSTMLHFTPIGACHLTAAQIGEISLALPRLTGWPRISEDGDRVSLAPYHLRKL